MGDRQISANISDETRKLIDKYAKTHGIKKGYLIEVALLHHLQALRELPTDVMIPPRLIVSEESLRNIASVLERPAAPTPAMKKLMRGGRAKGG